jgi:hypothetical protein
MIADTLILDTLISNTTTLLSGTINTLSLTDTDIADISNMQLTIFKDDVQFDITGVVTVGTDEVAIVTFIPPNGMMKECNMSMGTFTDTGAGDTLQVGYTTDDDDFLEPVQASTESLQFRVHADTPDNTLHFAALEPIIVTTVGAVAGTITVNVNGYIVS